MLKSAIIGCGRIADEHALAIQRTSLAKIVAACDAELLMAQQFSERFSVLHTFDDIETMLRTIKPNVVHITTPPQTHFDIAKLCLQQGCHVLVEKPFTLRTNEAKELIELAEKERLKITVGHNGQFDTAAIRMRKLIEDGFLGGKPIHMESIYCYNFGNAQSANALMSDKTHWIRRLPGQLLHNTISHGISRIAEFLTGPSPTVLAQGFTSRFLTQIDPQPFIDELRVIIHDNRDTTAYFTFSSQISPGQSMFIIYGPKNSLLVDHVHQSVLKLDNRTYKSYLNFFIPPIKNSQQHLANLRYNVSRFLRRDFHNDLGMKSLIESFYNSILNRAPLPISYREILLTSKIMDAIFDQIY